MLKLILITLFAFVSCQEPPNGIIWPDHPQQQPHEHHHHVMAHAREAGEEEELLGGPLMRMLNPLHLLNPFKPHIPGLRFARRRSGHIGPLRYGNFLLGAENPYAADDDEPQTPLGMQYQGAEEDAEAHHHHKKKKFQEAEAQLGAPQQYGAQYDHYHLAEPQHYQGAQYNYQEAHLAAPQQYAPFGAEAHYHQAEANLGAPQQYGAEYDHYNVGAPEPHIPEERRRHYK